MKLGLVLLAVTVGATPIPANLHLKATDTSPHPTTFSTLVPTYSPTPTAAPEPVKILFNSNDELKRARNQDWNEPKRDHWNPESKRDHWKRL